MKTVNGILVLSLLVSFAAVGGFTPVLLEGVANAARIDETAKDGRGGWLDLGSNDLRVLPSGSQTFARIPFDIPVCTSECHRTAIVLGRGGKEQLQLAAPAGLRGKRIYLLHAIAGGPLPQEHEIAARLTVTYKGGKAVERRLRTGRDVADWTSGKTFGNAARGWTAYNKNTQVSLFVSRFDLEENCDIERVAFAAEGNCPWMVLAVTVGDKVDPKGLVQKKPLKGTYLAPPPRAAALKALPAGLRPKNVILIIGDGMGQGAQRIASHYQYGRDDALLIQQFPFAGFCTTIPANAPVTDSAASATAFACGSKTSCGTLGLRISNEAERKQPKRLVSVAEKAHAAGMAVALVTNDRLVGATPGGFYAHVAGRGEATTIAEQASASGFDVLVGSSGNRQSPFVPEACGGMRKDGRNLLDEMVRAGYASVDGQTAFDAVPATQKTIGLFGKFEGEQSIAAAVSTALRHVGEAPKGFFMMAECATTDYGGHGNDPSLSVFGVMQLEWMVKAALDFAETRGDTLVVVTADHETGGISVARGATCGIVVNYTSTSHTSAPVPIYAYGPGAERFGDNIDNTDIARFFCELLELPPPN